MAEIPDVTIHAFEPDPRNYQAPHPNVRFHRAAIAECDGYGPLLLSLEGWGQEWTYSSSIKQPKNHLHRYPVTFGEAIEVELVALDTFASRALSVPTSGAMVCPGRQAAAADRLHMYGARGRQKRAPIPVHSE